MAFAAQDVENLRVIVDKATASPDTTIPGTTVVVVDREGNELFSHSAGEHGVTNPEKVTSESIFWMASCTKMICGIACMREVERGTMKLDDSEWLEGICLEFQALKVLNKNNELEEKKNGITLRMLLTHTAGFGYTFFNEQLRDWGPNINEFSGDIKDVVMPLLFQPGEGWEYGVGIDWAGIALERVTGTKLNDYIQKHICQPMGLSNVTMLPTEDMKKKLVSMHQRGPDGKLSRREHLMQRSLKAESAVEQIAVFNSGGAGAFAKPSEYAQIIAMLLNKGVSAKTNARILEKGTIDEMFKNQIPNFPQFGRQGIPASKPDLTNPLPDLYPTADNSPQGWGLTFMITEGATGRSKGTVWWAGLANLFWWADLENGIGGVVCSQILPFGDPQVLGLWFGVEAAAYQALKNMPKI